MRVPSELLPRCPKCGAEMSMNLRSDSTFVEDAGWYEAAGRYRDFAEAHSRGKVLCLELGVGMNTPAIIKYPFWQSTLANPQATYACINYGEAYAPRRIEDRSTLINADIDAVFSDVVEMIDDEEA